MSRTSTPDEELEKGRVQILSDKHGRPELPRNGGGFGNIYKGKMDGTVDVAIKVAKGSIENLGSHKIHNVNKMLAKELRTWKRLNQRHPNILPLIGITTEFGVFEPPLISFVCPWHDNGSLTSFLSTDAGKSLSTKLRLRIILDTCKGLSFLHNEGIAHGDLTGTNILLDKDLNALLSDFGLSTVIDHHFGSSSSSTSSTSAGGSLRWMAPENFSDDNKKLVRTSEGDIWSLGCIMFQVFSGYAPWTHKRDVDVIMYLRQRKVPKRLNHPLLHIDAYWRLIRNCWVAPHKRPCSGENEAKARQLYDECPVDDSIIDYRHTTRGRLPDIGFVDRSMVIKAGVPNISGLSPDPKDICNFLERHATNDSEMDFTEPTASSVNDIFIGLDGKIIVIFNSPQNRDKAVDSYDRQIWPSQSDGVHLVRCRDAKDQDFEGPTGAGLHIRHRFGDNALEAAPWLRQRYFIMKADSEDVFTQSQRRSRWKTQKHNRSRLNLAFLTGSQVWLIFSQNKSREFCGYARMKGIIPESASSVDSNMSDRSFDLPERRDSDRSLVESPTDSEGPESIFRATRFSAEFPVEWVTHRPLLFSKVKHIQNRWSKTESTQIHISRDGTEIAPEDAERLLELWPQHETGQPNGTTS